MRRIVICLVALFLCGCGKMNENADKAAMGNVQQKVAEENEKEKVLLFIDSEEKTKEAASVISDKIQAVVVEVKKLEDADLKEMISKADLIKMLEELSDRLTKVTGYSSSLPIFPSAEEYRQILLWHAENFKKMLGDNPNREVIRQAYWKKALSIYDHVPKAVDERSAAAASGYSRIGIDL